MEEGERGLDTNSALVVMKEGEVLLSLGKCDEPRAPFSTFKVALAVMGFDDGILIDKDTPKWPFFEEYEKNFQSWYTRAKGLEYNWCQDHTPKTFMKYSVVWFSHQITQRLGTDRFQHYVTLFDYGNKDCSGTPGQNDGLLNSWLGTSLVISPRQQAEFIHKLLTNKLPVSPDALQKTRETMDREEEWNGWKLYGKTGGGSGDTGWFVGWIQKEDEQPIVFAQYLDLSDSSLDLSGIPPHKSIGLRAKEVAKREILKSLAK